MSIDRIFRIKENKEGFSVWLNDHWVVDASTFLDDGKIQIDKSIFKIKSDDDLNRWILRVKV